MVFDRDEYRARLAKCRKAMAARGIDVLIEADPANINYLVGYDGWSFYYAQAIIVTLEDEDPLWIGRGVDVAGVVAGAVVLNLADRGATKEAVDA